MFDQEIISLRRQLEEKGVQTTQLQGCGDDVLNNIQTQYNVMLPTAYREIMKLLGKGAGPLLTDITFFYPEALNIHQDSLHVLETCYQLNIPQDMYIFANRYKEQFFSFMLSEGDDPKILRFQEGDAAFSVICPSLFTLLSAEIAVL